MPKAKPKSVHLADMLTPTPPAPPAELEKPATPAVPGELPPRPEPPYRRPRRRLRSGAVQPAMGAPKYLHLKEKTVRLWPSQTPDLTALALELDRLRPPGQGERITANTLIRLAVAWMLQVGDPLLRGITEEELATSLGLRDHPPEMPERPAPEPKERSRRRPTGRAGK